MSLPPLHFFIRQKVDLSVAFLALRTYHLVPVVSSSSVAGSKMDFDAEECCWSFDDAVDAEEEFTGLVPEQLDFMEGPPEDEPDVEPAPPTEQADSEPNAGKGLVVLPTSVANDDDSMDASSAGISHPSGSSGEAQQASVSSDAGNGVAEESTGNETSPGRLSPQGSPSEPTAAAEEKAKKFRQVRAKSKVPAEIMPVLPVKTNPHYLESVRAILGSLSFKEDFPM